MANIRDEWAGFIVSRFDDLVWNALTVKKTGWPSTSRHERGYGLEWERLRLRILERDCYLCQCRHCKAEGRTTLATQVDHIKPKADGGTDDPLNLQAIAADCHKRKTMEERGAEPKARLTIGLDGFPIR